MIFFKIKTDRCVYVDKYVEKWAFYRKTDRERVKWQSKMWIIPKKGKSETEWVNIVGICIM